MFSRGSCCIGVAISRVSQTEIIFIDLHEATFVRSQPQMVSHSEKRFDATGRWRFSLINAVWWWRCGALNPRGRRYILISLYLCITVILHMPAVFGLGEEGRLKRIDNIADTQTVAR